VEGMGLNLISRTFPAVACMVGDSTRETSDITSCPRTEI